MFETVSLYEDDAYEVSIVISFKVSQTQTRDLCFTKLVEVSFNSPSSMLRVMTATPAPIFAIRFAFIIPLVHSPNQHRGIRLCRSHLCTSGLLTAAALRSGSGAGMISFSTLPSYGQVVAKLQGSRYWTLPAWTERRRLQNPPFDHADYSIWDFKLFDEHKTCYWNILGDHDHSGQGP